MTDAEISNHGALLAMSAVLAHLLAVTCRDHPQILSALHRQLVDDMQSSLNQGMPGELSACQTAARLEASAIQELDQVFHRARQFHQREFGE